MYRNLDLLHTENSWICCAFGRHLKAAVAQVCGRCFTIRHSCLSLNFDGALVFARRACAARRLSWIEPAIPRRRATQ